MNCKLAWGCVFLLAALGLTGCVETKISVRLQKDGTGEAAVEQYIPAFLLGGQQAGAQFFKVEKNELLFRNEKEAREIMDGHAGVEVLNFMARDITSGDQVKVPALGSGGRATRTVVTFDNLESLGTQHFNFAVIPDGKDQYFVFRVSKELHEKYMDKSNGGMGPLLSSFVAGRYLTVHAELPSRVLASNASNIEWNVVEWRVPIGAIYNLVQDEILGWAKISGTDGLTLGKVRETMLQLVPGNDWRKPANFAPYFLLPTQEPPPRPRNKADGP